jgi:protein SCO1
MVFLREREPHRTIVVAGFSLRGAAQAKACGYAGALTTDGRRPRGILPSVKSRLSAALVLAAISASCSAAPYTWHGTAYEPPRPAPPLALPADDGGTFESDTAAGQVLMIYFGYVNCPDICPATLSNMAWTLTELGQASENVEAVFITVDPERDTLPVLATYLDGFSPSILGLRPEASDLPPLLDSFGVYAGLDLTSTSHEIEHSARLFLVDAHGDLRAHYPWDVPRQDILDDLKFLVGQAS